MLQGYGLGFTVGDHEAGHLVRTKAVTPNEGGVAAGFVVLDSPSRGLAG